MKTMVSKLPVKAECTGCLACLNSCGKNVESTPLTCDVAAMDVIHKQMKKVYTKEFLDSTDHDVN